MEIAQQQKEAENVSTSSKVAFENMQTQLLHIVPHVFAVAKTDGQVGCQGEWTICAYPDLRFYLVVKKNSVWVSVDQEDEAMDTSVLIGLTLLRQRENYHSINWQQVDRDIAKDLLWSSTWEPLKDKQSYSWIQFDLQLTAPSIPAD